MGFKARPQPLSRGLERTLADLASVLARHSGFGMLIGGIAAIAHGVPRATRDIDVTFAASHLDIAGLASELGRAKIVPRIPDALAFAAESHVLLMRHADTSVEVDVTRAWIPFELEALASSRPATIAGVNLPIAQPEDLVIFKSIAWRPQDQQDVERLLALHGERMDLSRVRRHVAQLSLAFEIERLPALDAVIARALGLEIGE